MFQKERRPNVIIDLLALPLVKMEKRPMKWQKKNKIVQHTVGFELLTEKMIFFGFLHAFLGFGSSA